MSSRVLSNNAKISTYRTIILPLVLYGYETLLFALKEERRFRLFDKMKLKRIFIPARKEGGKKCFRGAS